GSGQIQSGYELSDRTRQRCIERAFDGNVLETAQHARPLLKGKAWRAHLQLERGRLPRRVDASVEGEGRARGVHGETLEKPATRSAPEHAGQPLYRQIGFAADPRDVIEGQLPANGEVGEGEFRVQRLELGWHVSGAEIERIAQRNPAVDDLDRLHFDR